MQFLADGYTYKDLKNIYCQASPCFHSKQQLNRERNLS
jgi:hypothetical protein